MTYSREHMMLSREQMYEYKKLSRIHVMLSSEHTRWFVMLSSVLQQWRGDFMR